MLAQRNGLPAGCKPVRLTDHPEPQDAEKNAGGCCSFSSSSPPSGGCPWARLAGVDGCLSEPYCLWFQLLARAYWGEVELGLSSPNRSVSWARLREASRKNCVRSRLHSGLWLTSSSRPLGIGSDFTSPTIKPTPLPLSGEFFISCSLTCKREVGKEKPEGVTKGE
ncbi:hypothetical protein ILYODFUR_030077 [Ilyodon furcidens]|uniref:Uncharacterized protein n=1 Tax=Ilyodon furcidens TaxID=33524 RepID=A0ABV0SQB9_9TELE